MQPLRVREILQAVANGERTVDAAAEALRKLPSLGRGQDLGDVGERLREAL